MKILSPRQLLDRLDERFRVLTAGRRDALPRQQTLRALIDWSYDLLDERERCLLRRLGIFVNGFTLEGASAVACDDAMDEFAIFDILASLVDKSLVVAEPDEAMRYSLLESTRAYAREKLEEAGERELVAEGHLRYLRDLFVRAGESFENRPRDADVLALGVELDDARAALDWAAENERAEIGAELFVATNLWFQLGLEREEVKLAQRYATLLSGTDPALEARLWTKLSIAAGHLMMIPLAGEGAAKAAALARASRDPQILVKALFQCASVFARQHRATEAEAALSEAESLGVTTAYARLLLNERRANLAYSKGDLDGAAQLYGQRHALNQTLGNEDYMSCVLADVENARGNTDRAIAYARDGLTATRVNMPQRPYLLANLLSYLLRADAIDEAREAGRAALDFMQNGDPDGVLAAIAIEHVALIAALGGRTHAAARLEGYADARLRTAGCEREFTEITTYDRLLPILRERLTPAELEALFDEGAAWTADEAIAGAQEAARA